MLSGKNISSQEVIRRVLRDNPVSQSIPYVDAVEWVVDTLDLINAPRTYSPEIAMVKIEDYKGKLPCNYKQMTQATGSTTLGGIFPLTYSQNTFHPNGENINNNTNISTQDTTWNGLVVDLNQPVGVDTSGNPVFNYIDSQTLTSLPLQLVEMLRKNVPRYATYTLNDDYIFTSYKEGYALLSYLAYPFDCDGYPMIPDDIKFKLACQWAVQEKLDYMLWRQGKIDDKIMRYTTDQRNWYVGAAQSSANQLNLDDMESMRKTFTKIMLRTDLHKKAFVQM